MFTKSEKYNIRLALQKCATLEQLVDLLNSVQVLRAEKLDLKHPNTPITKKALSYYLYAKKDTYHAFTIPKRTGGERHIEAPDQYLRLVQRLIKDTIEAFFTPNEHATGFVPGKSIVTNAQQHTGKKYVYNIDLKDFFPSISFYRVWALLEKVYPFRLQKETARIIANLCCHQGKLPQGAPTSPMLSNAVCIRLDKRLAKLAKQRNATYTRYADDITFSANYPLFNKTFKQLLEQIIVAEGFATNPEKERLQCFNVKNEKGDIIRQRQSVTGIIVNQKTSVGKTYLRNLRAIVYNWQKHGYKASQTNFENYYLRTQGNIRRSGNVPPLSLYVSGKIAYLAMVNGKDCPHYKLLQLQFDTLCEKSEYTVDDLKNILNLWQKEGIDIAINKFFHLHNLQDAIGERATPATLAIDVTNRSKIEVKPLQLLSGLKTEEEIIKEKTKKYMRAPYETQEGTIAWKTESVGTDYEQLKIRYFRNPKVLNLLDTLVEAGKSYAEIIEILNNKFANEIVTLEKPMTVEECKELINLLCITNWRLENKSAFFNEENDMPLEVSAYKRIKIEGIDYVIYDPFYMWEIQFLVSNFEAYQKVFTGEKVDSPYNTMRLLDNARTVSIKQTLENNFQIDPNQAVWDYLFENDKIVQKITDLGYSKWEAIDCFINIHRQFSIKKIREENISDDELQIVLQQMSESKDMFFKNKYQLAEVKGGAETRNSKSSLNITDEEKKRIVKKFISIQLVKEVFSLMADYPNSKNHTEISINYAKYENMYQKINEEYVILKPFTFLN